MKVPSKRHDVRIIKVLLTIMVIVLVFYIIRELKNFFLPLAFAIFFAMVLEPAVKWLIGKGFKQSLAILSILLIAGALLFSAGFIVYRTGTQLAEESDKYMQKLDEQVHGTVEWLHNISGEEVDKDHLRSSLSIFQGSNTIIDEVTSIAGAMGALTLHSIITLIYLIIILNGITRYRKYFEYLGEGDDADVHQMINTFERVKSAVGKFMRVHTLMSLGTGITFGVICWIFGVRFAVFWGFLAFILNYIPTLGSIIATVPTALFGILTLESSTSITFFLICLVAAQFFWGNIMEPKLAGETVQLNFITVLLGLFLWGFIWGPVGMVMSVPLLVLIKEILSQYPSNQILVRLMESPNKETRLK